MSHVIAPRFIGPALDDGGYQVDYACRFNDDNSAYLERTPGITGDRKKWTWSGWLKIAGLTTAQNLFSGRSSGGNGDRLAYNNPSGGPSNLVFLWEDSADGLLVTTAVFRDPTAWYHIVFVSDTAQATPSNRAKLYVNGVQVTAFSSATYPSQNRDGGVNNTTVQRVGASQTPSQYLDGYLSQVCMIDGQALTPSSFGEFDANGVWRPIDITGLNYSGTNSFLLDFAIDSNLGNDVSGNNNDFTSSGLTAADQVIDTPTDNFCTWNPLIKPSAATEVRAALTDGNLMTIDAGASLAYAMGSVAIGTHGKFYWEAHPTVGDTTYIGLAKTDFTTFLVGNNALIWAYTSIGFTYGNGTTSAYGATYATGDVIGVAYDADNNTLEFFKNNVSQGTAFSSGMNSQPVVPFWGVATGGTNTCTINFGQRPFTYTPPSGFKALNTANLPEPTIKDGTADFQTTLYTGNGSVRSIDQTGNSTFRPDFAWIKNRSQTDNHKLLDVLRGATKEMSSNTNGAEATDANGLTTFDSDGFSLGTGANGYNDNAENFVAWQWKANGSGVSNTAGSITSTVSVNPIAGFSVIKWTGSNAAGTVGTGLSNIDLLVVKNAQAVENWIVWTKGFAGNQFLNLNGTAGVATDSNIWNNVAPAGGLFTVGASAATNGSGNALVAYAFASINGYCKVGSYIGNGSADGPFVYCGFKPAFVMVKNVDISSHWPMYDSSRDPYNPTYLDLLANRDLAENSTGNADIDFLSNGVKIRDTGANLNGSGNAFIFFAFAEYPFGGVDTTPATAR